MPRTLLSRQISIDGVVFVNHGATAGTTRPTGAGMVIWVGSVAPTNATGIDLVVRTDQAIP